MRLFFFQILKLKVICAKIRVINHIYHFSYYNIMYYLHEWFIYHYNSFYTYWKSIVGFNHMHGFFRFRFILDGIFTYRSHVFFRLSLSKVCVSVQWWAQREWTKPPFSFQRILQFLYLLCQSKYLTKNYLFYQ